MASSLKPHLRSQREQFGR